MTAIPYATPDRPTDLPFADQRGGMKAMGVLLILIGALSGCVAAKTPVDLLAARVPGRVAPMTRDIVVGGVLYALVAAVLVTTGVGSLRAKRWARPVALVITGSWLLRGTLGLVSWLLAGPDVERALASAGATGSGTGGGPPVPAGVAGTVRIVTPILMFVFGVLLPGGLFWFYVRDSVRRTVDHFDPVDAWTDRCPTPVLGLSAWLAAASLFTLSYCLWGVFPWFGRLLHGTPGVVALAVTSVLLAVLSAGAFRLSRFAWLGAALLLVTFAASNLTTFARVDPLDVYRLSGYPPETIMVMGQMRAAGRSVSTLGAALYGGVGLGYLMWVLKYFRKGRSGAMPTPAATADA